MGFTPPPAPPRKNDFGDDYDDEDFEDGYDDDDEGNRFDPYDQDESGCLQPILYILLILAVTLAASYLGYLRLFQ